METDNTVQNTSTSPALAGMDSAVSGAFSTDGFIKAKDSQTQETLDTYTSADSSSSNTSVLETPEQALQNVDTTNVNVVDTDELESNTKEVTVANANEDTIYQGSTIATELESILQGTAKVQEGVDKLKAEEQAQAEKDARVDELEGQREEIVDSITELGNLADFIEDVEADANLQKYREDLTEITNKIRTKELKFRRRIEGIQDAPALTRAQKNARIADVDMRQSREIADLEIIAMARQGRFNDAQAQVNRKVEIELLARQAKLDGLKFMYQENKERFTIEEQREYQERILAEERAYQTEYDKVKELEDLKLQMTINATEAGASVAELEAIQGAKDRTSLFSLDNAERYMKSKAQILDEQLANMQISKAGMEIQALLNTQDETSTTGVSPVTGKPYTQAQSQAGLFAYRIDDANQVLDKGKGFYGSQSGWLNVPKALRSEDRRLFEQAENNFITATLRRESGAAIAEEEYATAREIYIPLWSDSAEVLAKKKKARDTVLNALQNESVGAYETIKQQVESTAQSTGYDANSYLDAVEEQLQSGEMVYGSYN